MRRPDASIKLGLPWVSPFSRGGHAVSFSGMWIPSPMRSDTAWPPRLNGSSDALFLSGVRVFRRGEIGPALREHAVRTTFRKM